MCFFSNTISMTTYLTASIGGFVALALLIFSLYIFIKYRFVCVRMLSSTVMNCSFQNGEEQEKTCH